MFWNKTTLSAVARLLAVVLVLSATLDAGAESDVERRLERLRAQAAQDATEEANWRRKQDELLARKSSAETDLEQATEEYTRARRLRRRRGGSSPKAAQAVEDARGELTAAEQALDAFYEEARRAGVPPGWLRAGQ